jgi:hypothetical protein
MCQEMNVIYVEGSKQGWSEDLNKKMQAAEAKLLKEFPFAKVIRLVPECGCHNFEDPAYALFDREVAMVMYEVLYPTYKPVAYFEFG